MADSWDADDFEPQVPAKPKASDDKWEGEDEDDDIKDNWDDEDDDEEKKSGTEESSESKVGPKKKKRTFKDVLAEKEEKKRKDQEDRRKAEEEAAKRLSPEEQASEKLRQQRLQEDSDLELAKAAFGVSDDPTSKGAIDSYNPVTGEDFAELGILLKDKLLKYEKSGHYVGFLERLYRDCAAGLEPEDIKKLGSTLNTLANEKQKKEKGAKGKKKKGGKPKVSEGGELEDYGDTYDDYEDFI